MSDGPSLATAARRLPVVPFLDLAVPTIECFQVLGVDGVLVEVWRGHLPPAEALINMYRQLVVTRAVDQEAIHLQRQGQLGVYASSQGQEAAQVGSASALDRSRDWIVPSYRELGSAIVWGMAPEVILHTWRGTWYGNHDPVAMRYALLSIPIGTQTLHATGIAMGVKLDGADAVVMCYQGDGATSEGDSHEAFNFAGVFGAPVVFLVQNNQYAISLPVSQQTKAKTIAQKGIAYGIPAVRCDGNDVLAVYLATRAAVDEARAGEGPAIVEAVTFRMQPHTTADDADRYQSSDERDEWRARDPISRFGSFLRSEGCLSDELQQAIEQVAASEAARVRSEIYDAPALHPSTLFDNVYVDVPPHLEQQRHQLLSELAAGDVKSPAHELEEG